MKTFTLNAETPFNVNGRTYTKCVLMFMKTIKPKGEKPKSYKEIGMFTCKERGYYESGLVTLYKVGKRYAASLYKDGCFYPFYAFCMFE